VYDLSTQSGAYGNDWDLGALFRLIVNQIFVVHGDQRDMFRLVTLLDRSTNMQVSKGQDRLYALMHLAGDYEEGRIIVDYNKTEEQVMADAIAYHISQHRDLEFLVSCFRDVETTYPSWIPEGWMGGKPTGLGFPRRYDHELKPTKCSLNSVAVGDLRLSIRGVRVGWVQQYLLSNLTIFETVAGFWASPFGEHIHSYLGDINTGLPLEISRVFNAGIDRGSHNHQSIQTGLSYLWEIGSIPEQASRALDFGGEAIPDLLAPLKNSNKLAWSALRAVLLQSVGRSYIVTTNKHFGQVPECNIREEDEIWLVLGCPLPVVVRRQPDGSYSHICPARIPAFERHTNIASFVSGIQPGDRIGEWTVQDIELK